MTARILVAVLLRVIGLYILVTTAIALPSRIAYLMIPSSDNYEGAVVRASLIGSVMSLAGAVLIGWALYFKAQWISQRVVPEDSPAVAVMGGEQLYVALLSLAGVWLLVGGMEDLAASGTVVFLLHDNTERSLLFNQQAQQVARGVMAVVAGSILIVGQDRVVRLWQSIRGM